MSPAAHLSIPGLQVREHARLSAFTRFGLGGATDLLADADSEEVLIRALDSAMTAQIPLALIGGGTNLIASDHGFRGLVLRYTQSEMRNEPSFFEVSSGAILQNLVDKT